MASVLEKFNALPKKQQLQIVIAVPVLVVGLFGYLIKKDLDKLGAFEELPSILRRPGTEEALQNQITARQAEIDGLAGTIASGPQVKIKLESLQADIWAAEQRLPSQAEKSGMREQIGRLALQVGTDIAGSKLSLKSVLINEEAVNKTGSKASVQSIVYTVNVTGSLDAIIQFIDLIEKNERFMTVDSFTISPGTPTIDPQTHQRKPAEHTSTMRLKTYVYTSGRAKGKS